MVVPRKSILGHKKRTATLLTSSDGSMTLQSTSTTNLRPSNSSGGMNFDGNSDPLPRRKRSATSIPIPPPTSLPRPQPIILHSNSLTTVQQPSISLTSRKICTEV